VSAAPPPASQLYITTSFAEFALCSAPHKPKKQGEKTFYQEIGKLLIREGGKNGVLFLHHLDGECAVFLQEPRDAEGSGK
jgi:hypothetical protein